jgi:ABC-type sugar transport system ATPase subunit
LDEWTESLDGTAAQRLLQLVEQHRKEGKSIIFVCHDFRIVKKLADYIILIREGQYFIEYSRQQIEGDEELAMSIERGIAS